MRQRRRKRRRARIRAARKTPFYTNKEGRRALAKEEREKMDALCDGTVEELTKAMEEASSTPDAPSSEELQEGEPSLAGCSQEAAPHRHVPSHTKLETLTMAMVHELRRNAVVKGKGKEGGVENECEVASGHSDARPARTHDPIPDPAPFNSRASSITVFVCGVSSTSSSIPLKVKAGATILDLKVLVGKKVGVDASFLQVTSGATYCAVADAAKLHAVGIADLSEVMVSHTALHLPGGADFEHLQAQASRQRGSGAAGRTTSTEEFGGFEDGALESAQKAARLANAKVKRLKVELAELAAKDRAKDAELERALAEIASLRAQLERAKDPGHASQPAANDSEHHGSGAVIHPTIMGFVTLGNAPGVKALVDAAASDGKPLLKAMQAAIHTNPTDAVAQAALQEHGDKIGAAIRAEVHARISTTEIATATLKQCFAVIRIGNNSFEKVYDGIWGNVTVQEGGGIKAYNASTAEIMKISKGVALQRAEAKAPITLLTDAVDSLDAFFGFFRDFVAACKAEGIEIKLVLPKADDTPRCKDLLRVIEKCCLRPGKACGDASNVTDVLRAMVVVFSMEDISKVQGVLLKMVRDGKIVIDRTKDRFVATPSPGGWRDMLVNVHVVPKAGALVHVGEIQLVHDQLFNTRESLPGHEIYGRVRNAMEIVTVAFGDKKAAAKILTALGSVAEGEVEATEAKVAAAGGAAAQLSKFAALIGDDVVQELQRALSALAVNVAGSLGKFITLEAIVKIGPDLVQAAGQLVAGSSKEEKVNVLLQVMKIWQGVSLQDFHGFVAVTKGWDWSRATVKGAGWFGDELDVSKWAGVAEVDSSTGRIVKLSLGGVKGIGETLPDGIGQLNNLRSLDLSMCSTLTSLPASIGQLVNLTSLNLWGCGALTSLPALIGQLSNLKSLDLSYCKALTSLPDTFGQLVNLTSLNLSRCEALTSLPASIAQLVNLVSLILSYCKALTSLPAWIGQLVNLESLYLGYCKALTLPASFGQLVNLKSLDLKHSELASLPALIGQLSNLKSLNLHSCMALTSLPASIAQLVKLTSLNLDGCRALTSLPGLSHLLPKLKVENTENASKAVKKWVKKKCKANGK